MPLWNIGITVVLQSQKISLIQSKSQIDFSKNSTILAKAILQYCNFVPLAKAGCNSKYLKQYNYSIKFS